MAFPASFVLFDGNNWKTNIDVTEGYCEPVNFPVILHHVM